MPRSITAALEAHFGQDLTTLAVCYDIEKRDGTVLGFTSCDKDITYGGVTYNSFATANITNLEHLASTDADNLEIDIAFDDNYITKEDVQKGLYDKAIMRLFIINYEDTGMGIVKLTKGNLGTIQLGEHSAKAELMSMSNALKNKIGRVYAYRCDAELGDTRCGVTVSNFTVTGTVTAAASQTVFTDSGRSEAADYFKYGQVTITSGENSGWTRECKAYASGQFTLLFAFPYEIAVGDTYEAVAGCSNYPDTCKNTFDNYDRYRGYPDLPGNDHISKPFERSS